MEKESVCVRNPQTALLQSYPPLIFCGIFTGLPLVNMFKHTHIFKDSLTLVHLLLRACDSLKHSFRSTYPVLMYCTVHSYNLPAVWAMKHVIANRAIFATSQRTWNPQTTKWWCVWSECYDMSIKVLSITSAELQRGFNLSGTWHSVYTIPLTLFHPCFSVMLLGLKEFIRVETGKHLHALPILIGLNISQKVTATLWEFCPLFLSIDSLGCYRNLLFCYLIHIASQFLLDMISKLGKLIHSKIKGFFFEANELVNNVSRKWTDNKNPCLFVSCCNKLAISSYSMSGCN